MKTVILWIAIGFVGTTAMAQIPNYGFEDWETVGNYEVPTGWATMNGLSGTSFNSCTKSTDHYPENVGQYSVRLENNTALSQLTGSFGTIATGSFTYPLAPEFALESDPTSFNGYYKYAPLNGDEAWFTVALFNNGVQVANEQFTSGTAVNDWTAFSIPLTGYGTADSAFFMAFAFKPQSQIDGPNGNSVLYLDNLSFDEAITGIESLEGSIYLGVYPNPCYDMVTVTVKDATLINAQVYITSLQGALISQYVLQTETTRLDVSRFSTGIYLLSVVTDGGVKTQRMSVVH